MSGQVKGRRKKTQKNKTAATADVNERGVCASVVQRDFGRLQLIVSFLQPGTVELFCYDRTGHAEHSVGFDWLWTRLTWDLTLPVQPQPPYRSVFVVRWSRQCAVSELRCRARRARLMLI